MPAIPYAPSSHYTNLLVGTLAELAMRRSEVMAQARREQGQLSAQAWQGAGNAIAGSLGALAKHREEAPIRAQEAEARDLTIQAKRGELDAQGRALSDQRSLDTAMTTGGDDPAAIEQSLPGHLRLPFREAWQKSDTAKQTLAKAKTEYQVALHDAIGAQAHGLTVVGAHTNPEAVAELLQEAKGQGDVEADRYLAQLQQNPASAGGIVSALVGRSEKQRTLSGQEGDRTLRQTTETRMAEQARQAAADREADNKRADAAAIEVGRHNRAMEAHARVTEGGGSSNDITLAVQGMREGTLPPLLPGRASKEYLATMAEAKRQGYDLAGAATDWNATQKHIATLNNAQQLRLNQSINALPDLLDSVDTLAQKWKAGRFPLLNKASLALAKNGGLGRDAATIANQLDSQISDVVSDLGNVYMGGNSPTDHALQLAGKALNANWDEKVLRDMVALAKGNVTIRLNSIRNVGVQGASAGNPYAPASGADPLGIR